MKKCGLLVLACALALGGCLGRHEGHQEEQKQEPVTLQGLWSGQAKFRIDGAVTPVCEVSFKSELGAGTLTIEEVSARCAEAGSVMTRRFEYTFSPTASMDPFKNIYENGAWVGRMNSAGTYLNIKTPELDTDISIQPDGQMSISRLSYYDSSTQMSYELDGAAQLRRFAKTADLSRWEAVAKPANAASSAAEARVLECYTLGANPIVTRIDFGRTDYDELKLEMYGAVQVSAPSTQTYESSMTEGYIQKAAGKTVVWMRTEDATDHNKHEITITTSNFTTARMSWKGWVQGRRNPQSVCYFRRYF